jgi:hypothetical protein
MIEVLGDILERQKPPDSICLWRRGEASLPPHTRQLESDCSGIWGIRNKNRPIDGLFTI